MQERADWLPPTSPTPPVSSPVPGDAHAPAPPATPPQPSQSRLRRALGPLLALGVLVVRLLGPLKGVLVALPKLKLLTTSGTMLVSIAAYSLIWGWRFALGFVLLLLVHELGHVIQLRREGIEASAPMFIPFLGAVVAAKSLGENAAAEARVGLAGPILGTLGAAALVPVWLITGNDFWAALAFTGFFLNLFNLLPVVPLDGGRAMAAMAPWMWFVGFGAMLVLLLLWPNPILLIIVLLGGFETYRRWKQRKQGAEGNADYYRVKPLHRGLVALVYVGLIVALAAGMDVTHVERTFSDV
jgi:Zn-dependent protease